MNKERSGCSLQGQIMFKIGHEITPFFFTEISDGIGQVTAPLRLGEGTDQQLKRQRFVAADSKRRRQRLQDDQRFFVGLPDLFQLVRRPDRQPNDAFVFLRQFF